MSDVLMLKLMEQQRQLDSDADLMRQASNEIERLRARESELLMRAQSAEARIKRLEALLAEKAAA